MAKTRTFKVTNGRILFQCSVCNAKRMIAVAPNVRFRSVRCHKCSEITRCNLDRRLTLREQQLGKILALFPDGRSFDVNLADISLYGVGFDVSYRDVNKFLVGKEVQFQCNWNPQLLGMYRYIIRSVKGQRIGAQRNR